MALFTFSPFHFFAFLLCAHKWTRTQAGALGGLEAAAGGRRLVAPASSMAHEWGLAMQSLGIGP